MSRRGWLVLSVSGALMFVAAFVCLERRSTDLDADNVTPPVTDLVYLEEGWTAKVLLQLPSEVTAIAAFEEDPRRGRVFIGTGGRGGVYQADVDGSEYIHVASLITNEVGELPEHGLCPVNTLAMTDLDHDGTPELLASTCQVLPMSRPCTFVWSTPEGSKPVLRGLARPDIASSWSHGLGVILNEDGSPKSVVGTYCGHGELVEYRLVKGDGHEHFDGLSWNVVGQLPASGEQTQAADVDGDGKPEVCVAVGFALGKAAVHIYGDDSSTGTLPLMQVIDEGGRFANVRFLVVTKGVGPTRDLVAWWSTDHLRSGHVEIIRYRFGPKGLLDRTLIAEGDDHLWPTDGGMTVAAINENAELEVWFNSVKGDLWRLPIAGEGVPTVVARFGPGLGPLLAIPARSGRSARLLACHGKDVLRLEWTNRRKPM